MWDSAEANYSAKEDISNSEKIPKEQDPSTLTLDYILGLIAKASDRRKRVAKEITKPDFAGKSLSSSNSLENKGVDFCIILNKIC